MLKLLKSFDSLTFVFTRFQRKRLQLKYTLFLVERQAQTRQAQVLHQLRYPREGVDLASNVHVHDQAGKVELMS